MINGIRNCFMIPATIAAWAAGVACFGRRVCRSPEPSAFVRGLGRTMIG